MDSGNVTELAPEGPCGTMRTFGPKARNSVVRRRLASTCKLRRAAVTAAPAPSAKSMTKRRPRFAPSNRLIMRQNIALFVARGLVIIRLAGLAPARIAKRGAAEARCPER